MKFVVQVEDEVLHAAMRATRRELNQDVKQVFARVGGQQVLPYVRRATPSVTGTLRRSIIMRATTKGGYFTTSLTRRQGSRRLGLLEFGGTRTDVIRPRNAKALMLPDGVFVAHVGGTDTTRRFGGLVKRTTTRGRVYKEQAFMRDAVKDRRRFVVPALEIEMSRAIQAHIDRAGAG